MNGHFTCTDLGVGREGGWSRDAVGGEDQHKGGVYDPGQAEGAAGGLEQELCSCVIPHFDLGFAKGTFLLLAPISLFLVTLPTPGLSLAQAFAVPLVYSFPRSHSELGKLQK